MKTIDFLTIHLLERFLSWMQNGLVESLGNFGNILYYILAFLIFLNIFGVFVLIGTGIMYRIVYRVEKDEMYGFVPDRIKELEMDSKRLKELKQKEDSLIEEVRKRNDKDYLEILIALSKISDFDRKIEEKQEEINRYKYFLENNDVDNYIKHEEGEKEQKFKTKRFFQFGTIIGAIFMIIFLLCYFL